MFRIKGQVITSTLSNLQAYSPKYHFCNKCQSNTFILPNTKPNRFTYLVSHHGTSSNFPFIKLVRIQTKISFSRQSHSNTFILWNTKPNRFTYNISYQGTGSNISFIKLVGIQIKSSFSRHGSIQYFQFTEYKTKQVHISCLQQGASRDKFRHLSNFKRRVNSIL